jgi:hypothetical protein
MRIFGLRFCKRHRRFLKQFAADAEVVDINIPTTTEANVEANLKLAPRCTLHN